METLIITVIHHIILYILFQVVFLDVFEGFEKKNDIIFFELFVCTCLYKNIK